MQLVSRRRVSALPPAADTRSAYCHSQDTRRLHCICMGMQRPNEVFAQRLDRACAVHAVGAQLFHCLAKRVAALAKVAAVHPVKVSHKLLDVSREHGCNQISRMHHLISEVY